MIKYVEIREVFISDSLVQTRDDMLAVEEPLEINIQWPDELPQPLSVTMRTPGQDFELALGFLFTEAMIESLENLRAPLHVQNSENSIQIFLDTSVKSNFDQLKRNFYTTSSCGVCGKESIEAIRQVRRIPYHASRLHVSMNVVFSLPEKLRAIQKTFDKTGGIHAAALFDSSGEIVMMREDVGRHNALDKLIGAALLDAPQKYLEISDHILLLSGRASFELIQKSAMAGIQLICSIGAPSSLAVETAKAFGITLIGFLSGKKANIYTNTQKLIRNTTDHEN